jgi:hypothetical protein
MSLQFEDEKFGIHHIPNAHHHNHLHARNALRASCPPELTSPSKSSSSVSYSPPSSKQSLSTSLSTTPALRFLTDFEELKDVGKGGFGTVVKVRNKLDERDYAVKKIKLSKKHDSNLNKKILREVSTLSRLAHENVVRYYQAWIEEGPPINECKDPYEDYDDYLEDEDPSSFTNTSTASFTSIGGVSVVEIEGEEEDSASMDEDAVDENEDHYDDRFHDSLEDMVANPVFEDEEDNFDPGIFFGHFEGPKKSKRKNGFRKSKKQQKKKKKKSHSECGCVCNVCSSFYRDWEVSFDEWRDKGVALQPINVCQNCYCDQLYNLGVDTSKLSMALKRQSKVFT